MGQVPDGRDDRGGAPAFGLKVGQVLVHPQASALLREAMAKVERIAAALGIELPPACIEEKLEFIGRDVLP
ncbi:ketopantoate reductase C-terminal domain-containing protein [Novosphingobium mangrovi (ex Huang et al. 2023)]|uniref:Ketopantoate reductase C-terminal domain-containing protein n=1 Tax=Novosphingobium mangrovi (ex Huang et al. 2023) TaxID=2976432 RepID=A0ABT2IB22_9SPHN|nr:ketopantoate reductase C-terminal domain-containing protein [Novosphingobium mangrovi (ex Huang et al. 2023)]MCT2402030.1 hypothetical protein [Novosphingobium mangrovi (ex Huang et al. 2023)]